MKLHQLVPLPAITSYRRVAADHTNQAWVGLAGDSPAVFVKRYRGGRGGAREVAALRAMAGLRTVPGLVAWCTTGSGQVALVVTEFFAGDDGFAAALAAARAGRSFTAQAGAIGRALRRVHLRGVHGDFHLGQVLLAGASVRIIDFEGEPEARAAGGELGPLADVAGFIRSLDYAASLGAAPAGWAAGAEAAFTAAYGAVDPALLHDELLAKARYEVAYERRHRPHLAWIPEAAVRRLTR